MTKNELRWRWVLWGAFLFVLLTLIRSAEWASAHNMMALRWFFEALVVTGIGRLLYPVLRLDGVTPVIRINTENGVTHVEVHQEKAGS